MSRSHAWTWRHAILESGLPATTRHVLLTISCHMNDLGKGCYPTQEQLAEETGLSQRAIRTHIKLAVDAGWLAVKEHGFRGKSWRNHEYSPRWPDTQDVDGGAEPRSSPTQKRAEPRSSRSRSRCGTSFHKVRNEVPPSISYNLSIDCADDAGVAAPETAQNKMLCPAPIEKPAPIPTAVFDRAAELYAALGVTDESKSPGLLMLSEPLNWIEHGCDFDLDVLPTLRSIAQRRRNAAPPRSWAYCRDAVFAAREARIAPPPDRRTAPSPTNGYRATLGSMWTEEAKSRGLIDDPSNVSD